MEPGTWASPSSRSEAGTSRRICWRLEGKEQVSLCVDGLCEKKKMKKKPHRTRPPVREREREKEKKIKEVRGS